MSYDFDLSETKNRLRRNYRQQHNLDKPRAVWGDAFGVVADPNRPGKVYVRQVTSNGLSVARSVWAPRSLFGVQVGDPIKLKYEDGRLMVDGPDHAAMLSTGTDPVARQQQYDSPSTPQSNLETLNLVAKGGYLVSLKGWNVIANNLYYEVSYPDIDLEPYLPSSGEVRYAGIFVLDDYTDVEIATSTPVSVYDELDSQAAVRECLSAATPGNTPGWAVLLNGDMTEITQADIKIDSKDLRQTVNTSPGVYQGTVQTTNATTTTIFTFTIPASTTFAISAKVVARRTGGSSGTAEDGAYYERVTAIKNVAGTATIIGSVATPVTIEDQAGWDCTIDVTGATARVRVTGAANNNVSWMMIASILKVSS